MSTFSSSSRQARGGLKTTEPKQITAFVVFGDSTPSVVRWFFLLYVFGLPFDLPDFTLIPGSFTFSKLFGLLFIAAYFYDRFTGSHKTLLPRVPVPMRWFLAYAVMLSFGGIFMPETYLGELQGSLMTLLQLIIQFWLVSIVLQEEKMAQRALFVYAAGAAIVSMGLLLELPGFTAVTDVGTGRVSIEDADPNFLAVAMSLPAVALVGLCLDRAGLTKKILPIAMLMPIMVAILRTESRGGVLAFIIGCSVYALPFARSKGRLLSLLGACLTLVVVVFLVVRDPDSLERWKETYNTGDLSGRETIYEENFHMILERPLFGWHVGNFNVELGRRLGLPAQRDAHNVWLHLLGQDGLVGTSIFLTGLWFCGLAAWRARQGALGLIPLALFCVINVGSMSITAHITKPFWFILAIAVAALARETRLKVKVTLRHTENNSAKLCLNR